MAEVMTADRWLYATLAGDATLANLVGGTASPRIYSDLAPPNASTPYIVYQNQSAVDVRGVGTATIMVDSLYLVRGIAPVDSYTGTLENIANRIQTLLHGAAGTAGAGRVLACVREAPFRSPETRDGAIWRHLGGIYRIYPQEP